jgi:DNA-binding GntR family transcriptional regulator
MIWRSSASLNKRLATRTDCNIQDKDMDLAGFVSSSRENLASRTYAQLREALMAGRFWPGQRLRIRELSAAMGVSDTPVREAIMQLVREGGLEMRSGQSITVTRLSLTRYRELREIRLFLEGLATEKAVQLLTGADLKKLKKLHDALVRAEKDGDSEAATLTNFNFHFLIYRASQAEDLVSILETIWLRNGPLLKFLYPHAPPTYPGRHQHLILMEALQERDAVAARQAIRDDLIEGGALLVKLLSKIESGQAVVNEDADGNMRLEFLAPALG